MTERDIIEIVFATGGIAPKELAERLGVSTRTVRTYVQHANRLLDGCAVIEAKHGVGYTLRVVDAARFDEWRREQAAARHPGVPATKAERVTYLLNDLLARSSWITLDELSHMLYISRTTISRELKLVEATLNEFNLQIERRPHRGIRVVGEEKDRRVCLAYAVMQELTSANGEAPGHSRARIDAVARAIETVTERDGYRVNSVAYQNLLVHMAVALMRVEQGGYIPLQVEQLERIKRGHEFELAAQIAELIAAELGIALPEEEVAYLAIHLAGNQLLGSPAGDPENPEAAAGEGALKISDEVWNAVSEMLEVVWRTYRFDFRRDLELRMNLARHIVPLSVRLAYDMHVQNPLLDDIKLKYPLAFAMAQESAGVLERAFGGTLSEPECGYIALAFALALERRKAEQPKKNVLVVCGSGMGSSRLLEYRLRQFFSDSLDQVIACDVRSVARQDFSRIDYVFSTVPIEEPLPVPVCRISLFFEDDEAERLRDVLSQETRPGRIGAFFRRELFCAHLDAGSQDEVLELLCSRVIDAGFAPPPFLSLVRERERLLQTAYGNSVALPHAIEAVGGQTVVSVGLLDHAVDWAGTPVRCVFLISFARDPEPELEDFYQVVARLLENAADIHELLAHQSFETLLALVERYEPASEESGAPEAAGATADPADPASAAPAVPTPSDIPSDDASDFPC